MDSFRNFMENNQYLEGGATLTSGAAPKLPTENDISNLKTNAAALVDKDKELTAKDAQLDEADKDLARRVESLEQQIKKLATKEKEEKDIDDLTKKLNALEGAVMEISNLLLKLAN